MITPAAGTARASLAGVIRGEWVKLLGVKSTKWVVALSIGVPLLAIAIWALNANPASSSAFDESNAVLGSVTSSIFETLVLFVLFGALVGTSEYETRTISTTMAAIPRRWPVVVAKTVVVGVTTLAISLIVLPLGFFIASALVPTTSPVSLTEPAMIGALLGTVLFQVSAAVISLQVGLVLRSNIGAIALTFGFIYVLPGTINIVTLPAFQAFGHSFPGPASDSITALSTPAGGLPYAAAAIAIVIWTAVWFGASLFATKRRDV